MKDFIIKATAYNGMVRAYATTSTDTVEEARRRHDSWATASAALGRTITIAGMMGAMLKGEDSITTKVMGDGPLGGIIADANAKGEVRGYVVNPHVDFELNANGKLDVARAVGTEGNISVIKDLGLKDFFTGEVPIISGEISEDFTYYFANSEQVPSAVGAGVLVNPDHSILAAGGFIVQVMPGASEEVISQLEEKIQELPPISTLIREGNTPEQILHRLFGENQVKIHETVPMEFRCKCSKERLERAIKGLGDKEIQNMIDEDHGAEASCHFCNQTYQFTEEELEALKG
ncbi:MAG: Hsp33 family molecular chaperone HslO [Bacillota bacterium]|uniref:33 kDa chaperonin n=1 Tax=Virgibacillus salarius TaxID=447199 RepID=A0A941IA70_9BACI|nr:MULTISPECIES: Hsp33 family molecular chaperone HslO [Bacillaceae]NAZ10278.1 Hsp33 family molecular chaperone HslO [Agaribacter marinus]MBR7797569.1 Hsp33 family molecular chaperone HslO [Virgibacillus salarius]MCC2251845.1 Hsp33 family molecular chaperone HslO [Virgibacillus sp. AGTR]MDY7046140.1 Hsp33 family molecular chaperone HslO [Virgibacillus sp. M23]QRZ19114.1 Hsp33 family molecular chaperone HslO [Virgibacillus sp. AGTR]